MKKALLFSLLMCYPAIVSGGGFQLNDHGARGVAMGFANASGAGANASTIYFNPAGMTALEQGLHLSGGLSMIAPGSKFTGVTSFNQFTTTDLVDEQFFVPNFFAVWHNPDLHLAAGVGVFVPFGLGTEWPEDWVGRNLSVRAELTTIAINPNIAYSFLDDNVTLAAGVTLAFGNVKLRQNIFGFDPEPVVTLEGDGNAIGFNIATRITPADDLTIGVSFRSNIEIEYDDATATYEVIDELRPLFQDGGGSSTIEFPFELRAGVAYDIFDDLLLELAVDLVGWESYDTLSLVFEKGPGDPTQPRTINSPRNYENAVIVSLGGEYTLDEDIMLRGGVYFDQVPVESTYTQPLLPDADRFGFSAGVGYQIFENLSVDVGYLGIIGSQREVEDSPVNFNGVYNAWANVGALSINYSF